MITRPSFSKTKFSKIARASPPSPSASSHFPAKLKLAFTSNFDRWRFRLFLQAVFCHYPLPPLFFSFTYLQTSYNPPIRGQDAATPPICIQKWQNRMLLFFFWELRIIFVVIVRVTSWSFDWKRAQTYLKIAQCGEKVNLVLSIVVFWSSRSLLANLRTSGYLGQIRMSISRKSY